MIQVVLLNTNLISQEINQKKRESHDLLPQLFQTKLNSILFPE